MLSSKEKQFLGVLLSAKNALDSIGVRFHIHAGTALGAHREKSFIPHDHDIDTAIFYKDANTPQKIKKIKESMIANGFSISAELGKLDNGYEIQFSKDDVPLDIFWVYDGEYRGKKYYIISSYYGMCDSLPNGQCIWAYRPYDVEKIDFLGHDLYTVPATTLVDMYGEDWRTPKQYGYYEGINDGFYKGFTKDYYNPRPDIKFAFCFLLYDHVVHDSIWKNFFKEDNYPIRSFNIYTHLKTETEKTQKWVLDNKIPSIQTSWCGESLVYAYINMLKKALEDKTNKYFILLSGDCIPLYNYEQTYKKLTSTEKSRINIWRDEGLYKAGQWSILNRECAKMLIKLQDTKEGEKFVENIRNESGINYGCPDEFYPINWFVYKYGKPSTEDFKKHFKKQMTTYTYWKSGKSSPSKLKTPQLLKLKQEICDSGAIFARKFNKKSAKVIHGSC